MTSIPTLEPLELTGAASSFVAAPTEAATFDGLDPLGQPCAAAMLRGATPELEGNSGSTAV